MTEDPENFLDALGDVPAGEVGNAPDLPQEALGPLPPLTTEPVEFLVKKFVLSTMLDKAVKVLPTQDVMPVLKNFLLEIRPDRLRVLATDLQLSVIVATQLIRAETELRVVVPAKRFQEIVRTAPDGEIAMVVSGRSLQIRAGRNEWTLALQDAQDYPVLPEPGEAQFQIDRGDFIEAIEHTRYAIGTESVRPQLELIDFRAGTPGTVTASDGNRLQQVRVNFPVDLQLPSGAVEDLLRILRSHEMETVGVSMLENHLVFHVAGDLFMAGRLMAEFPDVEAAVLTPALQNDLVLTCDREALITAIRRVRVNAHPETNAVVLELADGRPCMVRCQDDTGNSAVEELDCGWSSGDLAVVVNHKHLMDMLAMSTSASADLRLGRGTTTRKPPVLLVDSGASALGVIAQMRADWVTQ